jgi:hypothetical protein
MDPEQVLTLAEACAQIHPRYPCLSSCRAFCDLRPGEARDVRRCDFDLNSTPATVTVGGQPRPGRAVLHARREPPAVTQGSRSPDNPEDRYPRARWCRASRSSGAERSSGSSATQRLPACIRSRLVPPSSNRGESFMRCTVAERRRTSFGSLLDQPEPQISDQSRKHSAKTCVEQ